MVTEAGGEEARSPRGTGDDVDALEALVIECLARHEQEGAAALEAVCGEHPELARELREEMEKLRLVGLLPAAPAGDLDEPMPERLGEFRLIERLGAGGMGVVYVAEQEPLGRRVALKLVRPELVYFPGQRERFRREVQAVARMQHPGIVPVYTVGEEKGLPYFAMELVEGCTLMDVLRELDGRDAATLSGRDMAQSIEQGLRARGSEVKPSSPLFEGSWSECCVHLVRQVAEALEHAHGRGVVHRDVKPSNIAVTPSGRAMLFDFGLASQRGLDQLTRSGSQAGSLPYMSPEQARGDQAVDARTDVYSLGATLYELLALRRPFEADSNEELRMRIVAGSAPRLRELNRSLARDLQVVCETALEVDTARRYATAGDFARDLGHLLAHRPIEARRAGVWLHALRWAQRHPTTGVAGAVALALVLFSALFFGWQQKVHGDELKIERDELRDVATDFLFEFHAAIANLPGATAARDLVVERARTLLDRLAQQSERDPVLVDNLADAYVRLAAIQCRPGWSSTGDAQRARESYERAQALARQLAADDPASPDVLRLEWWIASNFGNLLSAEFDANDGVVMLREALQLGERCRAQTPDDPTVAGGVAETAQLLASALNQVGLYDEALDVARRAVSLAELALARARDPQTARGLVAIAYQTLGRVQHNTDGAAVACDTLAKAVQLTADNADAKDATLKDRYLAAAALSAYGWEAAGIGRLSAARNALEQSCARFAQAAELDPHDAETRANLADTELKLASLCGQQGDLAAARAACARAQQLLDSVRDLGSAKRLRIRTAIGYQTLGQVLTIGNDRVAGVAAYRKAIELFEALLREHGANPATAVNLAASLHGLGLNLYRTGDTEAGARSMAEAIARWEELRHANPEWATHSDTLAEMHVSQGNAFEAGGDLERAREHYERGQTVIEELERAGAEADESERARALIEWKLGWLAYREGDEPTALERLPDAWQRLAKRCRTEPSDQDMWFAIRDVTLALAPMLDATEAHELRSGYLDLVRARAERDDARAVDLNECAWVLLTFEPADMRDPSTALRWAERAVALTQEQDARMLATLALACFESGDVARAVETQRKALALVPSDQGAESASLRRELASHLERYEYELATEH